MVVYGDDWDHYFLVKKTTSRRKIGKTHGKLEFGIDFCWGNLSL